MDLQRIIEQIGPEALLGLIQAILQMDENQLKQLIQALQQAVQQGGGGGAYQEAQPSQGQQNLFGSGM